MNQAHLLVLGIATILSGVSTSAEAWQLSSVESYYGRGVHHFFSGCYSCAEQSLTLALSWDPNDPRPYYFRALSRLRMGQEFAARDDMQIGAELEAQSRGQYGVGRALERVQGPDRLLLEKYRRQARQAHELGRVLQDRTRREQLLQRDEAVERRRIPVPLEGLTGDATADVFVPETEPRRPETIESQPSVVPLPAQPPAEGAPQPGAEDDTDPFLDDPQEAPASPAQPAPEDAEPPADTNATDEVESDEDPFSEDANPFDF